MTCGAANGLARICLNLSNLARLSNLHAGGQTRAFLIRTAVKSMLVYFIKINLRAALWQI
ncbi:hypothetical protein [Campylobacter showae]|uniref:hypothetical protein n=1 Tax=Campylobacter showae TaxID=204 RepID=UPI000F094A23|nr:hypothetical protein [Campylobacter showae]